MIFDLNYIKTYVRRVAMMNAAYLGAFGSSLAMTTGVYDLDQPQ